MELIYHITRTVDNLYYITFYMHYITIHPKYWQRGGLQMQPGSPSVPNSLAGLPGESAARETLAGYLGAPAGASWAPAGARCAPAGARSLQILTKPLHILQGMDGNQRKSTEITANCGKGRPGRPLPVTLGLQQAPAGASWAPAGASGAKLGGKTLGKSANPYQSANMVSFQCISQHITNELYLSHAPNFTYLTLPTLLTNLISFRFISAFSAFISAFRAI